MATIHDIARMSGCSIGTVSRVINNRADVSEATRRRVEAVIRKLDYQPNSNARMLRQSVSSDISIIVCSVNNAFLESVLEKVQIRIGEHGESANVQFVRKMGDEMRMAAQLVQRNKPRGLVFLGGSIPAFRKGFSQVDVPSVLIAASAEGLGFANLSSFTTNDRDAGAFVVRTLLAKGHRAIGILGGDPEEIVCGHVDEGSVGQRIYGAMEELERNGIAFGSGCGHEGCALTAEGGYQAASRLLQRTPDVTAVFAISDSIAIGAMRAFYDRGLSVPQDISMVGFDGMPYSAYSVPRLDTIRQDSAALAQRGIDDLLMRISYERPAVHEKIAYQYISGESVARPRQ